MFIQKTKTQNRVPDHLKASLALSKKFLRGEVNVEVPQEVDNIYFKRSGHRFMSMFTDVIMGWRLPMLQNEEQWQRVANVVDKFFSANVMPANCFKSHGSFFIHALCAIWKAVRDSSICGGTVIDSNEALVSNLKRIFNDCLTDSRHYLDEAWYKVFETCLL